MALAQNYIDNQIKNIKEKCLISWKIEKVQKVNNDPCFDNVKIIIKNDIWYYKVFTKYYKWGCEFDSIYQMYSWKIPSKWENIKFLTDWKYNLLSSQNYYNTTTYCDLNIENNDSANNYYIFLWTIFIVCIILNIISYKLLKVRK